MPRKKSIMQTLVVCNIKIVHMLVLRKSEGTALCNSLWTGRPEPNNPSLQYLASWNWDDITFPSHQTFDADDVSLSLTLDLQISTPYFTASWYDCHE